MTRILKILLPVLILLVPGIIAVLYFINAGKCDISGDYSYQIVNTFAHEPNAFTQGLVWDNGFLYEGTGLPGRSSLRKVELETGRVLKNYELPDEFFGEGITILQNNIIQLTYKSNIGFVYDKQTFELLREFEYPTEGWGITHNGKNLIMSDGTPTLYFLDPKTFDRLSSIDVYHENNLLWGLNELEYIDGRIYANIWPTDRIAVIEPKTGKVTAIVDLKGLLAEHDRSPDVDVLNGIAYDPAKHRLFVTGKFWPKLFEIKLIPAK
ncbi:MAG: glutaminyl-peptide cyclotransferase [Sedimentisphaerales bacterium]|nr:glutaminyl-peptide cyclotransferase [Sedimentisphaerales bacterium]